MKLRLTLVVCAFTLLAAPVASAHLITKPKDHTRSSIHASQLKNLAHARYVCNNGGGAHKRWSCKAVVWLTFQAKRTEASAWDVINAVFGSYGAQANVVASCESGHSIWAANGQYLGLFQMGESERSIYGHGGDVWSQARAAHRYFVASGSDWSPWQCKPW